MTLDGYRIGSRLNQFLPQCLIEIVLNFLLAPINLWDQKRRTTREACIKYGINIEDLPISGDIVSFEWNPVGVNAVEQCYSFVELADRLYPDEMEKVKKDLVVIGDIFHYCTDYNKFEGHPLIQQIEKEGKIREYHNLSVQYPYDTYNLYIKKSEQDKLKEIFDRNGFYY